MMLNLPDERRGGPAAIDAEVDERRFRVDLRKEQLKLVRIDRQRLGILPVAVGRRRNLTRSAKLPGCSLAFTLTDPCVQRSHLVLLERGHRARETPVLEHLADGAAEIIRTTSS